MTDQTNTQIAERYIAQQAIFAALKRGRRISFLDSQEFGCSEMHTQIHCIREKIRRDRLPYEIIGETFEFAPGKRAKMYHLNNLNTK